MPVDLVKNFIGFNTRYNLFQLGSKILVGVSGGMDSVVLLDLFFRIGNNFKLKIGVAHINHLLRGKDSARDEKFVIQLAQKYGMEIFVGRIDVKKVARKNKWSLEEAGRNIRYQFFEEIRRRQKYHQVATAHHLNDQAETVMMRFLSGAGVKGLSGVAPKMGTVIRPLLFATRPQIEAYTKKNKLKYCKDKTNRDVGFLRNRIRHTLLPLIEKKVNPETIHALGHQAEIHQELFQWITEESLRGLRQVTLAQSPEEITLDIIGWKRYFTTIQKEILKLAIESLAVRDSDLSFDKLNQLFEFVQSSRTGHHYQWGKNLQILIDRGKLKFSAGHEPTSVTQKVNLAEPVHWNHRILECGKLAKAPETWSGDRNIEVIDGGKLAWPLKVRKWRAGDKFQPLGSDKEIKLSNFLINQKIANDEKVQIPILVNGAEIVWVGGIRISQKYRVTPQTRIFIQLKFSL